MPKKNGNKQSGPNNSLNKQPSNWQLRDCKNQLKQITFKKTE